MRIVFEKSALQSTLSFAKMALPKKEIEPILNEFHCTVIGNNKLQIVTTDTDLMAVTTLEAQVQGEIGTAITIPGKKFMDLINRISSDKIEIEVSDSEIELAAGSYFGKLKTLGTEGYPDIRQISESSDSICMNRKELLNALEKINCAVNEDEAKKQLSAVQISNYGVAATNGKLTAVYKQDFGISDLYIAASCVDDLISVLRVFNGIENVFIYSDESFLIFKLADSIFFTRRVQVKFPDINKKVDIPSERECVKTINVVTKDFLKVLSRVCLSAPEDSKGIHLQVINQGELKVYAKDKVGFSGEEVIQANLENMTPGDDYYFNFDYLTQVIKQLTGERFTIALADSIRMPARIGEDKLLFFLMRLYDNSVE